MWMGLFSENLASFMSPDELTAIKLIRDGFGVDVTRTYQFWESAIARITTGTLTDHKCPWDVELVTPRGDIRIEVKSSQEFDCRFREGIRPVFKFAVPKGSKGKKATHVIVLVGIDAKQDVHCWAVPAAVIPQCSSITLTSPRVRRGPGRSKVDRYSCPPSQLLPEILRSYRDHLSMEGH